MSLIAEPIGNEETERYRALDNNRTFVFNGSPDAQHASDPVEMAPYRPQTDMPPPSRRRDSYSSSESRSANSWIPSGRLISRAEAATFVIYEDETAQPLEPGSAVNNQNARTRRNTDPRPMTPESTSWSSESASSTPSTIRLDDDGIVTDRERSATNDIIENDENRNILIRNIRSSPETTPSVPTPPPTPNAAPLAVRKRQKFTHAPLDDTPRMISPTRQRDLLSNTFRQFLNTPGYLLVPTISSSSARRASQMRKRKRDDVQMNTEETKSSSDLTTPSKDYDICEATQEIQPEPMKTLVIRRTRSLKTADQLKNTHNLRSKTKTFATTSRTRSAGF